MSRMLVVGCVAVLLIVGDGCRKRDANWKATYPVTGVLLVDGSPTEGIQITLNDKAGLDAKQPTISQTFSGRDGKFSLSTYEEGDGVPEGEYVLTFFWGQIDPRSMQFTGPDKLKDRYNDPEKSTFTVTVGKGKPVDLGTIELSAK